LWYAFAYPLAGVLGTRLPHRSFLIGGGLALVLLAIIAVLLRPRTEDQPTTPIGTTSESV